MRYKSIRTAAMTFAVMALLVSCGDKYKAEGIVKDFLNENLKSEPTYVSCKPLATTNRIDDNTLGKLQKETQANDPIFKKPIKYGAYKKLPELRYTRTTIVLGTDTFVRTIYLHPELLEDGVMAVKEN